MTLNSLNVLLLLLVLLSINSCWGFEDQIIERKCVTRISSVNKVYTGNVSRSSSMLYTFPIERYYFQDPFNTNLRIEVATDDFTTLECPILFAVGQKHLITSLEIPYTVDPEVSDNSFVYTSAGRTLCTQFKNAVAQSMNVTIRVSSCSAKNVTYSLKLSMKNDFVLPMDKEFSVQLTPSSPKYFGFRFSRPDVSLVRLKATSNDANCMTLSIQSPHCPVFDQETNIRYEGLWQTMSTTAAMSISKENRFADGFIVALVVHHDGESCKKSSSFHSPVENERVLRASIAKNVTILITNESRISPTIYFWCLCLPVVMTLCITTAVTLLFMNRHRWIRVEAIENFSSNNMSGLQNSAKKQSTVVSESPENLTVEEFLLQDLGNSPDNEEVPHASVRRDRYDSEISTTNRENKGNTVRVNEGEKRWNWTSSIFIAQFTIKDHAVALKSSRRFYWTVIIVAIFYSTPVYQLIIHYLRVLYRTGEYDICYYNYLCAHRLGMFIDFNHFWSNISYILFGLAFTFLVNRRASNLKFAKSRRRRRLVENVKEADVGGCFGSDKCTEFCGFPKIHGKWEYGVPQHYGVFYALGLALIMEGVLSAAYHLCPNQSSFQFDTCFMYVIAVLILLKIYQFRHPIHFGANQTFTILAGFVIVSVFGLMFEFQNNQAKVIYRWSFIACQYLAMIVTTIYYYSIGFIKEEEDMSICTDWSIFTKLGQLKSQPIHGDRLILPVITFTVSIAVLVYCEIDKMDFATYLLYVLVGSVLASILYYVAIMKPLHGEFKNRTWVQPTIYFLGAGAIGVFAVRYFVRSPAEWQLSASASRESNEECMKAWFPFHPFYDSHDIWHFFSAACLFLMFMGLLIVDDDLITTPQTRIPVF